MAAEVLAARGVRIEAVREAIVLALSRGEQLEPPGPPMAPANTYQWPQIPFVPSRMVHILPSGMRFPLESFAVHSVPFRFLVHWFEEILGGQVIDDTVLPGIYGFELNERVDTPEACIQLVRDAAGLVIARERRETPTLIVRQPT